MCERNRSSKDWPFVFQVGISIVNWFSGCIPLQFIKRYKKKNLAPKHFLKQICPNKNRWLKILWALCLSNIYVGTPFRYITKLWIRTTKTSIVSRNVIKMYRQSIVSPVYVKILLYSLSYSFTCSEKKYIPTYR